MRIAALTALFCLLVQPALAAETPTAATREAQARSIAGLDFQDRADFEAAERGFLGTRTDPKIHAADGRVIFDLQAYAFVDGDPPPSVNPSLWRQARLLSKHGLFQVAEGVYQVRGFDLANVTFIRGRSGWIVIDPLTSVETAQAALELVNARLGARPVKAVIYTHSHADHFGGARGVVTEEDVRIGRVQVIAPDGFLEHAVSENIIAGPAMSRRAQYQFGTFLPRDPSGQVSAGIGQSLSLGTQSLIPPNRSIRRTGETLAVDGVRLEFQVTPGTEAPAEMNVYLPDLRVLCMAENANATLHNLLTPRGALVRDAKVWADYLTEAVQLFGGRTDVVFTSHAWPRFGAQQVREHLTRHRDAYKFLHDQSVRLMNKGLTGEEIAARLELPPSLAREWYNRGYYGTVSFNVRAVYQRYMGWYDANPVNLAALGAAEESRRYVAALGGAGRVIELATKASDAGDYAWAAELLNRIVMSDSSHAAAREQLARAYVQLAYAAESSLWRNMYLSAADELRRGVRKAPGGGMSLDLVRNTPTTDLLDLMAVRLDPAKAQPLSLDLHLSDRDERHRLEVENGVLVHTPLPKAAPPAADQISLARSDFLALMQAPASLHALLSSGKASARGDSTALLRLLSWLESPDPAFPILWR